MLSTGFRIKILKKAMEPPQQGGWMPLPTSQHGGYYREVGDHREYWYPSQDHAKQAYDYHTQQAKAYEAQIKQYPFGTPENDQAQLNAWEHRAHADGAYGHSLAAGSSSPINVKHINSLRQLVEPPPEKEQAQDQPPVQSPVQPPEQEPEVQRQEEKTPPAPTEESPPENRGVLADTGHEPGSVEHVQELHRRIKEKYGLDDYWESDHVGRMKKLREALPEQDKFFAEEVVHGGDGWKVASYPANGDDGTFRPSGYFNLMSVALGFTDWDSEKEKAKNIYFSEKKRRNKRRWENFQKGLEEGNGKLANFLDPSHEDHKLLEYMLGRQAIWTDAVRNEIESDRTVVYRGMNKVPEEIVDKIKRRNFDQQAASSWSSFKKTAERFAEGSEREGTMNIVIRAVVPLEHCLVGHQTEGFGEGEVIMGSIKGVKSVDISYL